MTAQLLKEHMDENNLSQAQAGAQLGKSPATINLYLKGTYKGDTESIDKAVVELLERHNSKKKDVKTDFVRTPTAKRILEICGLAHSMIDIQLVIGDAGLGKTMALRHYAQTNSNVIFLEVDPTFSSKVLLSEICNALGMSDKAGRSNHIMMKAVVDKLKGSERLLIVDEAELLSLNTLEVIRRIHDKAGIGVVLAGMPRLRSNLYGSKGQYKQLYSRVGLALELNNQLPAADVAMLCEATLGTTKFNKRLYEVSKGNARRLNKLMRGASRLAVINKCDINNQIIDRFAKMLVA